MDYLKHQTSVFMEYLISELQRNWQQGVKTGSYEISYAISLWKILTQKSSCYSNAE